MSSHALSLFRPDDNDASVTVADVVNARLDFLADRVGKNDFSADNLANHRYYLARFADAFTIAASLCRQEDLERWIDINPQWKSGHTKKTAVNVVVSCFTWAADPEVRLISACPFRRIKAITAIPYRPRRAASVEEYLTVMRHASLALKQGLFFVYRTGCRPCEMRELLRPWCHLGAADPHLRLVWHKTIRKTGKEKVIGLDDVTVRFLKHMLRREWNDPRACNCPLASMIQHARGDHVFFNCNGGPWSRRAFSLNVRRCAERAGLDAGVEKRFSGGCLRTTYACDLIEMGFSNREAADALGHESTWMVDHVYGAATRQRAAHLGNIANKAAKKRGK